MLLSRRGSRRTACACLLALAFLSGAAWLLPRAIPGGTASAADSTFVRRIPVTANDLVYDAVSKKLYASVPSSAGAGGNSITPIDPATGGVGAPVFIGSEPGRLAVSDDGKYLYAYLEGATAVRRFDLTTQTPGLQFALRSTPTSAPYAPYDFAVLPGKSESLAVSVNSTVAVYDDNVRRATAVNSIYNSPYVEFGAADTLYGVGSSLYKISVAAGGATLTSSTTISGGGDFRVAGGRVYMPTGQVYDAATGALQGTFPDLSSYSGSAALVLPDTAAGRVFFLIPTPGISSAVTLRAYDINTFVLLGSVQIPVAYASPASFVRWGANGVAFRVRNFNGTPDGQLYVVQTTLIPSAEPVPTATPTPSPTPSPSPTPTPVTYVRKLALPANDLIYDPTRQTIYASVPSVAGAAGNTVTAIDPVTGALGASTFVGSEPNRVALTDDAQYLYVGLDGAGAVRRFNLTDNTAGLQFSLGTSQYDGPYFARDLATLAGQPEQVAVARGQGYYSLSVAVYDGGVQRTTTAGGGDALESSAQPSTLYNSGSYQDYQKLSVNASGVSVSGAIYGGGTTGDFSVAGETIYSRYGKVIDPLTGTLKGTFPGVTGYSWGPLVAPDPDHGRVFFLTSNGNGGATLRAYDIDTFLPVGTLDIPGVAGTPAALVRWGADGLAFRTTGGGSYYESTVTASGQVFLIQTSLVSGAAPAEPPAVPTPTPTPTPPAPVIDVSQLTLPTNDLVYEPTRKLLYASVPGTAGGGAGNSVTPVDPATETIGTSVFVGSEPKRMALTDDAQYLYVGLDGAGAVRRFDLTDNTAGLQFSLGNSQFYGPNKALDLAALPGQPTSVAVSRTNGGGTGVAVYDNDAQRPNVASNYSPTYIEFGAAADTLYSSSNSYSNILKMSVDAQGVTNVSATPVGASGDFRMAGGRIYMPSGQVVDAATGTLVGKFAVTTYNNLVAPDPANGRVYFLIGSDYYGGYSDVTLTLKAFDIDTFRPLGSVQVPGVATQPTSLVRWGANGLAFRTGPNTNTASGAPPGNQIYLVRTSLVPSNEVIPTKVKFTLSNYTVYEYGPSATVNVIRSGDHSAAATVNYATADGTAKAGQDYTATSGTLTFAAGETSKTFSVPVSSDSLYEGPETINLTLSGPTVATLASPSSATLTIFDDDSKPYIYVNYPSMTETDTGTADLTFTVSVSNLTVENVSVNYATTNGTATSGSDYVASTGTVTVPAGSLSATFTVKVNGDYTVEPDEYFYLNLSNPVNGYIATPQTYGTVRNNDTPGGFVFDAATYSVSEGAGSLAVTVKRVGGASGDVSVQYATHDVTAKAGQDYTAATGTFSFASGETSKTFNIPINDDSLAESSETITLLLSNATGGALYGTPSAATVTISDNDLPGTFVFDAATYNVSEGAGSLAVTVSRSGGVSDGIKVNYATTDGTAKAGQDYTAASGTLTFAAGETSKTFNIPIADDALAESDETIALLLSGATGGSTLGTPAAATVTIGDNDAAGTFVFSAESYTVVEGAGSVAVTVTRTGGVSDGITVNYATSDGTAKVGQDYAATSGTLTFAAGETSKTFSVPVTDDGTDEPDETIALLLSGATGGANLGTPAAATITISDNDHPIFSFASANYEVAEGAGQLILKIVRAGDPSAAATVVYSTSDGTATEMSDYGLTLGTLRFAPGETEKTLALIVNDDALSEPAETLLVTLGAATGAAVGTPAVATVTIGGGEEASQANPLDDSRFFVRQHYHDFLNREPDASGLDFWTNDIEQCGADARCREMKRVNVSAAFFLSIEFQQTGYLVYRLNQSAFNAREHQRWREFLADTQEIGRDVQVGIGAWEAKLEANKSAFVAQFVARPEFVAAYAGMNSAQFVDALNANTYDPLAAGLGGALSQAERDQLVSDLEQSRKTRAEVLRAVAENAEFSRRHSNRAFVLMQYYGYLRRNPDSAPDTNFDGYNFWLSKLNEFGGNFFQAEMVKAFLDSIEYRKRFGQ